MSVYMVKAFRRFARKEGLEDRQLRDAAAAVMNGHADADLGGGVFKQRVARPGSGKSGGFRTLLLFRKGAHCFFVSGFAKNAQSNISARELAALKEAADVLLAYSDAALADMQAGGEMFKIEEPDDAPEARP